MTPVIQSLDDILPFVDPAVGIIHSQRETYSVVNYVFTVDDTFASAMARECRGLKFDLDGRLIGRPFHKFFNLGEKGAPEEEPWDSPHVVMDKLDGSMVHPVILNGDLVFMTRMGVSPQAQAALAHADAGVRALCLDMIAAGFTPVFEYTAPDNRIVVAYDAPALTLLAVRDMVTGAYLDHGALERLGAKHGVGVVATRGIVEDVKSFWAATRAMEEGEGYVIAFANGHRLKIKTDAYALRHKAVSGLAHEHNVLGLVAHDAVDDVLPMLAPEVAAQVQAYSDTVTDALARLTAEIEAIVAEHGSLPRKDFAAVVKAEVDPKAQVAAFKALDGVPVRDSLRDMLVRNAGTGAKVDAIRPLLGMTWTSPQSAE